MRPYLNYIALFLLLLFCRAMVPDALLLELHSHQHSTHNTLPDDTSISQEHTHCPVEDIFNTPYQGTITAVDAALPLHLTTYTISGFSLILPYKNTLLPLRGPPVA